jgi:hypothetical protein
MTARASVRKSRCSFGDGGALGGSSSNRMHPLASTVAAARVSIRWERHIWHTTPHHGPEMLRLLVHEMCHQYRPPGSVGTTATACTMHEPRQWAAVSLVSMKSKSIPQQKAPTEIIAGF